MATKKCSKCLEIKQEEEFNMDGKWRRSVCQKCQKEYWRARNKQKRKELSLKQAKYYEQNRESILRIKKEYYQRKKEAIKNQRKIRYWANRDHEKERLIHLNKKYLKSHPERAIKYRENWLRKHPGYQAKYVRERRRKDPKFRLRSIISCQIYFSLRSSKSKRGWQSLVGYTVDQLKARLEKTMPKGYSWKDFLSGKLHIDHKIPVSAFNFSSAEDIDFKRCFSLNNLQLLPALENLKKGGNIEKPFQPSLSGLYGVAK